MEFRWVALIALWTCLAGPIFSAPSAPSAKSGTPQAAVKSSPAGKPVKP
jgi:hypothetical protein